MKIKKIFLFIILFLIMVFTAYDIHYHKVLSEIRNGKIEIYTGDEINNSQIDGYMYDDKGNMYVLYKNKWINATCENNE